MSSDLKNKILDLIEEDEEFRKAVRSSIRIKEDDIRSENSSKEKTEDDSDMSRRNFLKKAIGGAAGLGAATMLPSATAFNINSENGLKYFNSRGNQQFSIENGALSVDKIGTPAYPVSSANIQRIESESISSNVTVFEDEEGTARAVTDDKTYTSNIGVFDAAQKAIEHYLTEKAGNISLVFKPGNYVVQTTLTIDEEIGKNTNRIIIRGEGSADGAYFMTSQISGETMIEIDPNSESDPNDIIYGVSIKNINLDHRDTKAGTSGGGAGTSERDADGIYINDVRDLHIKRVGVQGYGHGLRLRQIWQGEVDYLMCRTCGSDADNKSSVLVETGRRSGSQTPDWWSPPVHNAVNHLQFRHLQGGPGWEGEAFVEMSTPELTYTKDGETITRQPRIRYSGFLHPNVECSGNTFLKTHANANIYIGGCQCKDTDPLIDQDGGRVVVSGGEIENPGQLLDSNSGYAMIDGVDCTSSEDKILVNAKGGAYLQVSNLRTYGGQRCINASAVNVLNVSNVHAQATEQAAIRVRNCNQTTISNCTLRKVCQADQSIENSPSPENPITLRNSGPVAISSIVADVPSENSGRAVIKDIYESGPLTISSVVEGNNINGVLTPHSGSLLTENAGTATVADGRKRVSVNHGLVEAPSSAKISVTPLSGLDSAKTWHVGNIDDSSFEIVVDSTPAQDVTFNWQAKL